MSEPDDLTPPEQRVSDRVHEVARVATAGVAGLIAAAGGVGPALLAAGGQMLVELFFQEPMKQRWEDWSKRVASAVEEALESRSDADLARLIDELAADESFVTTVQEATLVAVRTHQEEKLDALRNAVLSSALPNAPEMDLRSIYLRLVDDLSPTHLRILSILADPFGSIEEAGGLGNLSRRASKVSVESLVRAALPTLEPGEWRVFGQQLATEGLLTADTLVGSWSWPEAFNPRVSGHGRQFLRFIEGRIAPPSPEAVRARITALEQLRRSLADRARSQRFEVSPVRYVEAVPNDGPVVTGLLVRFPREAARNPVANGNPPSLAEARITVLGESAIDVFAWGQDPELIGSQPLEFEIGEDGFSVNGSPHAHASGAAEEVIRVLESVFPDRRYWPSPR